MPLSYAYGQELPPFRQGLVPRWLANLPGRVSHPLGYATLPGRTFKRFYIDAFAGTGFRELRENRETIPHPGKGLWGDIPPDDEETKTFLDGSARIALQAVPKFHKYLFIEKDEQKCHALRNMVAKDFPDMNDAVKVHHGEANVKLQETCSRFKSYHRAVLFLDPFGMQVSWDTIRAVAETRSIDMWLLFPIGSVARMLPESGNIPEGWKERLDDLFGDQTWHDEFYQIQPMRTLFDDNLDVTHRIANTKVIQQSVTKRLKTLFPAVLDEPLQLNNSKNSPLFMLYFAAGNEDGGKIAIKIAENIMKGMRHG